MIEPRTLTDAVAAGNARISLGDVERHRVLVEFNRTSRDYPLHLTLHELFEAQVSRSPDATAVIFGDAQLTYHELNERADAMAHSLRQHGVGPNRPVAVCLERSLQLPVSLLGVLKAGGGYVALDPNDPPERLGFALDDCQAPVLITTQDVIGALSTRTVHTVCLDSSLSGSTTPAPTGNAPGSSSTDLAYVLYTSGSTGQPKGVMVSHRSAVNRLFGMQEDYHLTTGDVVLQKTPFTFDVSIWEFFWTLMVGARMVLAQPGGHKDLDHLIDLIRSHGVTTLHFVPPVLDAFLRHPQVSRCTSVRRVFCGGESLARRTEQRFFTQLDAALYHLYGPTEATVDVTSWVCQRHSHLDTVPIGRPLQNVQLYILDEEMAPVPIGEPGELYVGGVQVAIGYLNRPALTAERFIPDPFSADAGARLYRTGDRCRWRRDGTIDFLGRLDHQVKIRGVRIELGEVEAALRQHPSVQQVVVTVREDEPSAKQLVAYVVPVSGPALTSDALTRFLRQTLPEQMVPAAVVFLDALPLSTNGKVDRQALPAPGSARPRLSESFVAPRTPVEHTLASIWSQVLHLDHVGVHDNVFDLGAHSLLMTQVVGRVRGACHVDLPLRAIFEAPTVAELAAYLERTASQAASRPAGRGVSESPAE